MADQVRTLSGWSNGYGKLVSGLFCCFVFAVPFVFKSGMRFYAHAPKEMVIQIGVLALLAIILCNYAVEDLQFKIPQVFLAVLLFVGYCFASLLWAINPYEGFMRVLTWLACALTILIIVNVVNIEHLFIALFLSGFLVSIIGLMQWLNMINFIPQSFPPAATFANKNMAAHYVVFTLPLAGCLYKKYFKFLLPLSIPMLAYIGVCRSDAAVLALFAAVLFLCIVKKWYKPVVVSVLAVGLYAAISPPDGLLERLDWWRNASRMAIDYPSGVGFGNFSIMYPLYYAESDAMAMSTHVEVWAAHNDFLHLWAETGWAGIALMVLVFVVAVKNIKFNDNWQYVAASLVSVGVAASFSFPMLQPMPVLFTACMLGALTV